MTHKQFQPIYYFCLSHYSTKNSNTAYSLKPVAIVAIYLCYAFILMKQTGSLPIQLEFMELPLSHNKHKLICLRFISSSTVTPVQIYNVTLELFLSWTNCRGPALCTHYRVVIADFVPHAYYLMRIITLLYYYIHIKLDVYKRSTYKII